MIYLDNAATTQIKSEVLEAMMPYFRDLYENPSASYDSAKIVKKTIEQAREQVANLINCKPSEVFFTSGGTESDNWAINMIAENYSNKGKHIITTAIEHHAVLHTTKRLEENGFEVTYVGVDEKGIIDIEQLENSIRPDTILVSVMTANNEVGTIQPIKEIGKIARKNKVIFHTDAVQAYGHIPIDVSKMKIDMLSASGHKIFGPKGIGILYIKSGIKTSSFMQGGGQEKGYRPGTYNVPAIVGMGKASEMAMETIDRNIEKYIRDYFLNRLIDEIPLCYLNGDDKERLPNNINVRFEYVDAEALLVLLNRHGICASVGSACTTGQIEPSHVLISIGLNSEQAGESIRLTVSDFTTLNDIDIAVEMLKSSVERLRSASGKYREYIEKKQGH